MKKVVCIVGATGVGKSDISLEVAKHFGNEIINGDSVQVYKRLNIGSAKIIDMKGIKHHLIDFLDLDKDYSVCDFQHDARKIIDESNDIKIISGGTGLYIQSVLFDYEFEASRRDLDFSKRFENYSNQELFDYLLQIDKSIDLNKLHPNNRKRVLRAIEVKESLDKSIHSFDNKNEKIYDYFICYLSMDREVLYERINKRVDLMIQDGLINEVKELYDEGIIIHAIGYKEFIPYFEGEISLDTAIDEIKKNTRHLAKRQETWFKNQMESKFYDPTDYDKCIKNIISDIDRWL